ncbi:MAG: beta strand repeat-containing protein [Phycisphaerae bacterium]
MKPTLSSRALVHTAALAAAAMLASSASAGVAYNWNTFPAGGSGTWNDGTQWTPSDGTAYPGSDPAVLDDSATINPSAAGYGAYTVNYTGMNAASISTLTIKGGTGAASSDTLTFNANATLATTGSIVLNATSCTTGSVTFNVNDATVSTAGVSTSGLVSLNVNGNSNLTSTGAFGGNASKITFNIADGASASFGGMSAGSTNSVISGTVNGNLTTTSYSTNGSADSGNLTIGASAGTVSLGDVKLQRTSGNSSTPSATSNGLHVKGGTVSANNFQIGISNSAAIAEIGGGTLTVNGATFNVGQNTGGRRSAIFVDGGTLVGTNAAGLTVGASNAPNTGGGTGMLSISSGTATLEKLTLGANQATTATSSSNNVGNLSMSGGNLYLGSGGIVGINATFASGVNLGSTYNITLTGGTVGAKDHWSSSADMTINTNAVTFLAADASNLAHDISLAGNLSGNGSLTKTGAGNLTLSGTASYSGPTSINAGALFVTGAITASTATVAPGATLGGNGNITAPVTNNGTLNPGNTGPGSIGNLILGGGITFGDNAALAVDFDASSADQIQVAGNIVLGNNGSLTLNALDTTTAGTYIIATYTGTESGTFSNLPANVSVDYTTGNAITVTIGGAATPEPASLALLSLGAAALLTRRRKA